MKVKKPIFSFMLSLVLPGLGQIYLEDFNTGLILFFLSLWGYLSMPFGGGAVLFTVWVYGIIHAVYLYKLKNTGINSFWLNRFWLYIFAMFPVSISLFSAFRNLGPR